jgi:cytochrome c oxidase subunit 2
VTVQVVVAALDPAGTSARDVAGLWWLMVALASGVVVIVGIGLAIGLRRPGGGEPVTGDDTRIGPGAADAEDDAGGATARRWIAWGGVALPLVVISIVFGVTLRSMGAVSADRPTEFTIEVTGHQWWWEIEYPAHGVVTANEVHVPEGTAVRLRLQSADVVHSFWVPALAGKLDLLPDHANELVIDADTAGRYQGVCAEFCGLQHTKMEIVVIAHDRAAFDEWIAAQRQPAAEPESPASARGLDLLVGAGCGSCHAIAGTPAAGDEDPAPDLTHVAGRDSIGAGAADPTANDLRDWITDPHTIKEGVKMPAAELDADQIDAIVTYLEGLR